jgi:hypothetical protein
MIVRDPRSYLRAFLQDRQGRELHAHDVVYILKTAAREVLAAEGLQNRCEQIGVFADWVHHDAIDRSPAGARALANIAESVPLHGVDEKHDNKWLEEGVNNDVSFWKLRLELLAFCRRFQMSEGMFTTAEAWHQFALPLAFEVSGRPVSIDPNRGGAVGQARARVDVSATPTAYRPARVTIAAEDPRKWRWIIETMNSTKIVVQVLFGSFRQGDFPTPRGWVSFLA